MSQHFPQFGSQSAYDDAFPTLPPREITVPQEVCFQIGVFKDMVKQYRKLDDQVIIRLNRAQAQLRDTNRKEGKPATDGTNAMCTRLWSEMMTGWTHRQTLLSYCVSTVSSSLATKQSLLAGQDARLDGSGSGSISYSSAPDSGRYKSDEEREAKMQAGIKGRNLREAMFSEEVLKNQLVNEQAVEAIIRKRSLDAFKSRCPFFLPSEKDVDGKKLWEAADRGRVIHVEIPGVGTRT